MLFFANTRPNLKKAAKKRARNKMLLPKPGHATAGCGKIQLIFLTATTVFGTIWMKPHRGVKKPKEENTMTFADKLIALRKRNGWSQETLAEKLDVSRQAVSKWESEQSVPDLERVVALSALFDVSADYLLKDSSEEPPAFSETSAVHSVSMQEAVAFLQTRMSSAQRIAAGVTLCILSPVPLILRTNPAIAMKHCANADSFSSSSPEGWQIS